MVVAVTLVTPWKLAHPSDARFCYFLSGFSEGSDALPISHLRALLSCDDSGPMLSPPLLDFLCGALHPDPSARFTLEQLLAHPWLAL